MKPFERTATRLLLETPIFRLREDRATHPRTGESGAYVVLENPDWVNIVALTEDARLVLVRQWRHGTRTFELGLPAGMVDEGEDPLATAARELAEETGYAGGRLSLLGQVRPNAAYQQNLCFSVLAEDCRLVGPQRLDPSEDIEVVLATVDEVRGWMKDGTMDGALGLTALFLWRDSLGAISWR